MQQGHRKGSHQDQQSSQHEKIDRGNNIMDLKERRLSLRGAELMRQVTFDYILSNRTACVKPPTWEMHTTQGWTRHLYMIALVREGGGIW